MAEEELKMLWSYRGEEKARVADFFHTLSRPGWRLEKERANGCQVWRLPGAPPGGGGLGGESFIHTGAPDPDLCTDLHATAGVRERPRLCASADVRPPCAGENVHTIMGVATARALPPHAPRSPPAHCCVLPGSSSAASAGAAARAAAGRRGMVGP